MFGLLKKLFYFFMLLIPTVLVAVTIAIFMYHPKSDKGMNINPDKNYEISDNIVYFLQNDYRWKNIPLGRSKYSIGSHGCLVTCLATLLNLYGKETDPQKLNETFIKNDIYTDTGDIIWGNIQRAYPGAKVAMPLKVDNEKINEALSRGEYPLARVKYKGTGYQHWVLIVGSKYGVYQCMDPSDLKSPIPLTVHGGKIYSYRIVSF